MAGDDTEFFIKLPPRTQGGLPHGFFARGIFHFLCGGAIVRLPHFVFNKKDAGSFLRNGFICRIFPVGNQASNCKKAAVQAAGQVVCMANAQSVKFSAKKERGGESTF